MVGPLTSIAVGVAAVRAVVRHPRGLLLMVVEGLAGSNLLVGALNLVPGLPLDGGRVLKSAVWKLTGSVHRGTVVVAALGRPGDRGRRACSGRSCSASCSTSSRTSSTSCSPSSSASSCGPAPRALAAARLRRRLPAPRRARPGPPYPLGARGPAAGRGRAPRPRRPGRRHRDRDRQRAARRRRQRGRPAGHPRGAPAVAGRLHRRARRGRRAVAAREHLAARTWSGRSPPPRPPSTSWSRTTARSTAC